MTQEKANKIFDGDLGRQLLEFYSTSDGSVFIRYGEAVAWTNTLINANPTEYVDTSITTWLREPNDNQKQNK